MCLKYHTFRRSKWLSASKSCNPEAAARLQMQNGSRFIYPLVNFLPWGWFDKQQKCLLVCYNISTLPCIYHRYTTNFLWVRSNHYKQHSQKSFTSLLLDSLSPDVRKGPPYPCIYTISPPPTLSRPYIYPFFTVTIRDYRVRSVQS